MYFGFGQIAAARGIRRIAASRRLVSAIGGAAACALLAVLVAGALVAAAVEDARRLRISNLTSLAVLATAFVAMLLHGFDPALWQNWVAFAAILAAGTAAFAGGLLGGGDVKLLAALGLWFNLAGAALLIGATFIAGGVVAALYILTRAVRGAKRSGDSKSSQIPYGLAIPAGALVVLGAQLNQRLGAPSGPLPQSSVAPR